MQLQPSVRPPAGAELVHAFCDDWMQGRIEHVLAAPVEREAVRQRAARVGGHEVEAGSSDSSDAAATSSPHVIVVLVRGLSLASSRSRLPRTLRAMARLRRGGQFVGATFRRFAVAGGGGEEALRALATGSLSGMAATRSSSTSSLWRHYARWGYVTAYGEAGCANAPSQAFGIDLDLEASRGEATTKSAIGSRGHASASADHVLIEPFCSLDTQLRARAAVMGGAATVDAAAAAAARRWRGYNRTARYAGVASGCMGGDGAVVEPLFSYMSTFLSERLYRGVPKLAVLALPAEPSEGSSPSRADRSAPQPSSSELDGRLARLLSETLRRAPNTAVFLLSDAPAHTELLAATLDAGRNRTRQPARLQARVSPALHVLFPAASNGTRSAAAAAAAALAQNARLPASAVDVHATLRQLPLLALSKRLPGGTLPSTFTSRRQPAAGGGVAVGGCSLLSPLPVSRACADTHASAAWCTLQAAISQPKASVVGALRSPQALPRRLHAAAKAVSGLVTSDMSMSSSSSSPPPPLSSSMLPLSSTVEKAADTAAPARLLCALRAARRRAAAPPEAASATTHDNATRRASTHACGGRTVRPPDCAVSATAADAGLLALVAAESDIFSCDAPTFASLRCSVLTIDCPAERMPMYSIGLHPKLHAYIGPTAMPNGTEHVTAYCQHADFLGSACERVGREGKPSNRAAIRRQCPLLSHGWVVDVAVENQRQRSVVLAARRRRRDFSRRRERSPGATSGGDRSTASPSPSTGDGDGGQLNVLLLMLDSIAAARFRTGMPMTHALLEAWAAEHDPPREPSPSAGGSRQARSAARRGWRSFRFDMFAVAGSNSPRNQFPMLSGLTSREWARDHGGRALECIVPGFDDGVRASREHTCEQWAFDDFRAAGYVSFFGTNMCDWGVMEEVYPFDTLHPPVDHHLMEPWCHRDYDVDKLYFRPMSRCVGGRAAHAPLMDYERQFLSSYRGLPRLSWTIYLEGHEPSFRAMANLDADLAAHLLRLRASHAHNTAVLLLSDHGIHYGKYYDRAKAGPSEHAMPVFYALFPRAHLARHPRISRALCVNQRRLVSPFDVHATLLHMLSYPEPPALPDWSGHSSPMRPRSLLSIVPRDRTCAEAGVPPEACPCAGG